eukprot:SAG31_NODE_46073_length_256_cov_0.649682_1_plen_45_part_10
MSGQVTANARRLEAKGALEGKDELRALLGLQVDYHTEEWHRINQT